MTRKTGRLTLPAAAFMAAALAVPAAPAAFGISADNLAGQPVELRGISVPLPPPSIFWMP
ncbi:MAG: hypothetical protein RLO50_08100 [Azospirillaceae bacterium]